MVGDAYGRAIKNRMDRFPPSIRGLGANKHCLPGGAPSACDFCYAEGWSKRSGQVKWGKHPRRRTTDLYWRTPLSWNDRAPVFQKQWGRRQRVFAPL